MNDFFFALGDFFTWTFSFLPAAGNLPNYTLIAVCLIFMIYWIGQMAKFEKYESK